MKQYYGFYTNKSGQYSLNVNSSTEKRFENHFIICGAVNYMINLILPLRTRSIRDINTIIILDPEPLPSALA